MDCEICKEKAQQANSIHSSDPFPDTVCLPGQLDQGGAGSEPPRELHLDEASRIVKFMETENIIGSQGLEEGGIASCCSMGVWFT